jgi:uncharacterized protein (TIGR02145 family)
MKTKIFVCFVIFIFTLSLKAQKIGIIRENEMVFLLDKSGKNQKKVQYSSVYPCAFSKDFVIAEKKGYSLVNLTTGKITQLAESFEDLRMEGDTSHISSDELIRFSVKEKIGLIKLPDKIVLPAEYSEIYPKSDSRSFFLLVKGKSWQFFYPQSNKFSISFQVQNSSYLYLDNGLSYLPDNERFIVRAEGNYHLMKADGTDFMLDNFFSKNKDLTLDGMSMILCIKDGKYGYIDDRANVQIPFKYDWAEPMEGNAVVKFEGYYGVIRDNGQQIVPCVYDKIIKVSPELFKATKDKKVINLLENGNPYDDMLPIEEKNKYGFATEDQTIKIPCIYDSVQQFRYGLAPVNLAGKWGYIIPTGNLIISNQFEDVARFNAYGVAIAKLNRKWGIIDFSGKFILEPQFDSIDPQNEFSLTLFNRTGIYEFGADKKLNLVSINPEKGSFTDTRDSKTYKTVKIGSQTWMAQNISYKTDESWNYENNELNGETYGRLYTWKAALSACPAGWHLPSDDDWKTLERILGMSEEEVNSTYYKRGYNLAPLFKIGGSAGFDIQMSGFRHGYDKNFYKLGEVCMMWTSTSNGSDFAFTRSFYPDADMLSRDNNYVQYGLPVRCVKN